MSIKSCLCSTACLLLVSSAAWAVAADAPSNQFIQVNFTANKPIYKAQFTENEFVNGWGIAIRPAGAGGHFWVTAKDVSYEYVGDVSASPDEALRVMHTDNLKYVKLPVGGKDNFATGVVFSDSKENFVITQEIQGEEPITAPAKFLFASDGGIISAWTERKKDNGSFDRPIKALKVIDQSKEGAQFFGLAINADYSRLYAADFGKQPQIRVYDGQFKPVAMAFDMPFDDNKNGKVDPGEYAPFNIQLLRTPTGAQHLFVTYAKTQACPQEEISNGVCKKGDLFAGEEDTSKPGYGRLAEFDENGKWIATWNDGGTLSAPWGVAFAPKDYSVFANALLVANFGDGTIAAYDAQTHDFIDVLRAPNGKPVVIEKIWGILFGNGASLGDTNALYFAAGPKDEADGLFGSLRLMQNTAKE